MWLYCPELMYMQPLTWKKKSSSDKVGGGDIGIIVGIVRDTMTMDGVFIRVLQPGIEGYPMTGEIIIETTCGTGALGIIIPSIMVTWIGIGEAVIGEMIMDGIVLAVLAVLAGTEEDLIGAMMALADTMVPGDTAVPAGAGTGAVTVPAIDTPDK
jgi:hypothetical protein